MTTLTQVNKQLSTRPDDEKFCSTIELQQHYHNLDRVSQAAIYDPSMLKFGLDGGGAVALIGPKGNGARPTNWAWRQLTGLIGAPAQYLGDLAQTAPGVVVDALNAGLEARRPTDQIQILARRPADVVEVHAATGPKYGRILNSTVMDGVVDHFGDGVNGDWRVPGIFGKKVEKVTKANTTLFGSDQEMFICLANEDKKVIVKGRRDGKDGEMSRFFWIRNSEVGAGIYEFGFGYHDYFCSNRMIWGVEDFKQIRIKHTSGAPERYLVEALPSIREFMNAQTKDLTKRIAAAQAKKLDVPAEEFLRRWFTAPATTKVLAAHMVEENRPIETLWDANTGVTAYAKSIPWQSERLAVEKIGGKILDLSL